MADFPTRGIPLPFAGGHLYYRKISFGAGPVTVWIHGFLENSNMWSPIFPALRPDGTHLLLDLPGHGDSDVFDTIHTMDFMADCVKAMLDSEGIDAPVRVIGHSMGGYVALAFAERYSEFLSAINLYHSTSFSDTEEKKENRNRAIEAIEEGRTFFVKSSVENLFASSLRKDLQKEINLATKWALQTKPKGISSALAGMRDRPDRTSVFNSTANAFAIVGMLDPAVDPIKESSFLAQNPQIESVIIEEVGHMSHLENTDAAVRALTHFLNETS